MTVNRPRRPGDLAPFLEPGPSADLDVIQGVVTAFDPDTNENTVELAGGRIETDLPVIGDPGLLGVDSVVMVLRNRTRYFILGPIGGSPTVAVWNRSTSTVNITSTSVVGSGFGVAFTAPPSGMVMVWWRDRLSFDKTSGMLRRVISRIEVRTGSIVGSGTPVYTSNDDDAVEIGASVSGTFGMRGNGASMVRITGLTPGDAYNVEIAHRLNNATDVTATSESRSILVKGLP